MGILRYRDLGGGNDQYSKLEGSYQVLKVRGLSDRFVNLTRENAKLGNKVHREGGIGTGLGSCPPFIKTDEFTPVSEVSSPAQR